MNDQDEIEVWLKRISKAEKAYEPYHEQIKKIRKYYKNEDGKNKQNIFWSSIETLKPFLYFKQPKPYVERKEKTADAVAALAAKILEKALEWNLAQFDFDGVIKYARNDFLLSGCGLAYERYTPQFKSVDGIDLIDSEQVETVYIDPVNFIADNDKVGIWEDCTWFAKKIYMTKREVIDQFGKETEAFLITDDEDDRDKSVAVYEIWDKASRKVKYLTKDCKTRFLKIVDDVFGVEGFWTMPKPIFATLTNDSIIPVPDFKEIEPMLLELDGVNARMKATMKALKVSGCYDNSFPELGQIMNKDVALVSLSDFEKLKQAGGIQGIIDFVPIAQYVDALQALAERRQDLISQIYEVAGVSDIMRGNSDPSETATAVKKKTNFGTLRNQDRQNDMQRFITDLFKIKAEIICERFSPETLMGFLSEDDLRDIQTVQRAIELLRTDKLRGMVLGIETDTSFSQEDTATKVQGAVELINTMVTTSFQAISAQPFLLPLYRKMVESIVATLPDARQFEPVLEEVFNKIAEELNQPAPQTPNPEEQKVQLSAQKNNQEFEIKKEQNRLKREELELKKQSEDNKILMTREEAQMQYDLGKRKIDAGLAQSANITTGYVRGFNV